MDSFSKTSRVFTGKNLSFFLFFLSLNLFLFSPHLLANQGKPFDHSLWNQFLKKFVNEKGEVDYAGVKKDPSLLEAYFKQLSPPSKKDPKKRVALELDVWPREERMALMINAYHAGLINEVRLRYPVKEVGNIQNFWEKESVALGQDKMSLNAIRKYLIQTFRDAKIHTVLSWGSRGGPRLRQEAFTGPLVEGQIFMATREFVNNPYFVQIPSGKKKIQISRIFQWYGKDFLFSFPMRENERGFSDLDFAALSFLAYYLEDAQKIQYLENEKYKIKYLPFDWNLNDWKPEPENPS